VTPLHVALDKKNFKAAKSLMVMGAKVDMKTKKGLKPVHYLVKSLLTLSINQLTLQSLQSFETPTTYNQDEVILRKKMKDSIYSALQINLQNEEETNEKEDEYGDDDDFEQEEEEGEEDKETFEYDEEDIQEVMGETNCRKVSHFDSFGDPHDQLPTAYTSNQFIQVPEKDYYECAKELFMKSGPSSLTHQSTQKGNFMLPPIPHPEILNTLLPFSVHSFHNNNNRNSSFHQLFPPHSVRWLPYLRWENEMCFGSSSHPSHESSSMNSGSLQTPLFSIVQWGSVDSLEQFLDLSFSFSFTPEDGCDQEEDVLIQVLLLGIAFGKMDVIQMAIHKLGWNKEKFNLYVFMDITFLGSSFSLHFSLFFFQFLDRMVSDLSKR